MTRIEPTSPKQNIRTTDPTKNSRIKLLKIFRDRDLSPINNRYYIYIHNDEEIMLSVPIDHKLPIEFIHEVPGEARYVLQTNGLETGSSGNLQLKIYHSSSGKEISLKENQQEIDNELVLIVDKNIHIPMKELKSLEEDFIYLVQQACAYFLSLVAK